MNQSALVLEDDEEWNLLHEIMRDWLENGNKDWADSFDPVEDAHDDEKALFYSMRQLARRIKDAC